MSLRHNLKTLDEHKWERKENCMDCMEINTGQTQVPDMCDIEREEINTEEIKRDRQGIYYNLEIRKMEMPVTELTRLYCIILGTMT